MPLIKDQDKPQIRKLFERLSQDVKLIMFTQDHECQFCEMTRTLIEEVVALSPKLAAEIHDFAKEPELAAHYHIDKIPAVAVVGERDHRIRFYGIPAGYEFPTLLEAILDASRGDPGLPVDIQNELAKVDRPVHLQVMVTPT
ncbi:MAG: thioredoxin family protein [Candidatus Eisenbacteria bacterium]|nr:thioredoxin family protein [Candidatus Eisenbacteria bacterium]